jgi:hypothetical protein
MARFLDFIEAVFEKKEQNQEALRNQSGPYLDLRKDPDVLSLAAMENDLQEIVDEMTHLIKDGNTVPYMKLKLESMRYRLASYVSPICCVCGESPATWSENGDGWYCEKCGGAIKP